MVLEVVDPGQLATIQDAGRPCAADLGVPHAGACDPLALAAANLLLGNDPDAPVVELTLGMTELLVRADCVVALAGADLGIRVRPDGRWLRPGTSVMLRAGSRLAATAMPPHGCRACLAVAGGVEAPRVLGSASTSPFGGFGGIGGRPLRAGDLIRPAASSRMTGAGHQWPGPGPSSGVPAGPEARRLRVTRGPHWRSLGDVAVAGILAGTWTVDVASDRVGIRLDRLASDAPLSGLPTVEVASFAMVWGALQLPPGGQPIVLLADGPTVGGYPVPFVVITADRPILGQLRAGDALRFSAVDHGEARAARIDAEAALAEAAAQLRVAHAVW